MNSLEFFQGPGWGAALLNLSAQAALLGALVFAVTRLCGRWIPPSWRAVLWFLVIARLLIPIAPPSRFSLQNLFLKPKPQPIAAMAAPSRFAIKIQDLGEAEPGPIAFPEPLPEPKAPGKSFSMRSALALVWLAGAAASLLALGARSLLLRRRLRGADAPTESIARALENCREEIGLRYPLRVSVSRDVASPALTGLFPARLIVPESFNQFSPEQIRKILLHELAHIKQGHLLFHWLALLARCVHWFNPIVHFAGARLREECELAADAAALENANDSERIAYGETILKVLAQTTAPSSALALGMAEQARHLEQRLRALAEPNRRSFGSLGIVALLALGVAGLSGADTTPPTASSADVKSPAAALAAAPLTDAATTTTVTRLKPILPIEDSRRLILSGQIHEAESILQKAVNSGGVEIPTGYTQESVTTIFSPLVETNAPNKDLDKTVQAAGHLSREETNSSARKRLQQKLDTLRFDSFILNENAPLDEILKGLNYECRKLDTKGRGVNIILSQSKDPKGQDVEVEKFTFKFNLPLRDLTLRQLLDAMVKVARPPAGASQDASLRYSVEDYAIVFSQVIEPEKLYTRTFRLDANTVTQGLNSLHFPNPSPMPARPDPFDSIGSDGLFTSPALSRYSQFLTPVTNDSTLYYRVREYFKAAGVDFEAKFGDGTNAARKVMYYNDRRGLLFVRATLKDLEVIENALHAVDANRPQIAYQAKFVEMPKEMAWRFFGENLPKAWGVSPETNVTFALSREEVAAWIKKLEQMQKVDIITAPGVTSLAGRAVRVAVEETAPVKRENGPIGPSLDLVATIRTNKMLALQSKVTWTALLALENAEGTTNSVPKFRVRQALFDQAVPWGGSQVIFFPNSIFLPYAASGNVPVLGEIPHLGRLFRSEVSTNSREAAFVVVTPTPIGSDGAPIPEPK